VGRIDAGHGVGHFVAVPGDTCPPRLPTIRSLIVQWQGAYHAETGVALASVEIDTVAEVAGSEPADYWARDRVIHPTTPEANRTQGDLVIPLRDPRE
jgi:hypothetical protein